MEDTEAKNNTSATSPLFSFSNPNASFGFGFGFGTAAGPPPPPPPPAVEVIISEESPVAAANLELVVVDDTLSIYKASIAKGHPEDAVNNYKRTFSNVVVEEELRATLEILEEAFTILTVEQLTQLQQ